MMPTGPRWISSCSTPRPVVSPSGIGRLAARASREHVGAGSSWTCQAPSCSRRAASLAGQPAAIRMRTSSRARRRRDVPVRAQLALGTVAGAAQIALALDDRVAAGPPMHAEREHDREDRGWVLGHRCDREDTPASSTSTTSDLPWTPAVTRIAPTTTNRDPDHREAGVRPICPTSRSSGVGWGSVRPSRRACRPGPGDPAPRSRRAQPRSWGPARSHRQRRLGEPPARRPRRAGRRRSPHRPRPAAGRRPARPPRPGRATRACAGGGRR
jgi:hypothetical protein